MRFLYCFLPVLLALPACVNLQPRTPVPSGDAAADVLPGAEKETALGDKILSAVRDSDYSKFAAVLAGRTEFDITKKDFESSYSGLSGKYGKIVSWTPLTTLRTPLVRNLIWKVTFEKNLPDGAKQTQDMLFRLVTGVSEGQIKVLALGFF